MNDDDESEDEPMVLPPHRKSAARAQPRHVFAAVAGACAPCQVSAVWRRRGRHRARAEFNRARAPRRARCQVVKRKVAQPVKFGCNLSGSLAQGRRACAQVLRVAAESLELGAGGAHSGAGAQRHPEPFAPIQAAAIISVISVKVIKYMIGETSAEM